MGKGEAADALPLDQLRMTDALAHVVRGFKDEAVPHAEGDIDPAQDAATMETELILADHTIAERRIEKLESLVMKTHRDEAQAGAGHPAQGALAARAREIPLRNVDFTDQERFRLRGFTFLSLKPLLIVVNADEADASRLDEGAAAFGLREFTKHPSTGVVALSAKIEDEITQLGAEDCSRVPQRPRHQRAGAGQDDPRLLRAAWAASRSSPSARTSAGPGRSAARRRLERPRV